MRIITWLAVILLLPRPALAQDVIVTASSPLEAKLASLDAKTPLVNQRRFAQYAQLLTDLDRGCKETRAQIGTLVIKTVAGLWQKQIDVTHLKFLQAMNDAIARDAQGPNVASCTDTASRVATSMGNP